MKKFLVWSYDTLSGVFFCSGISTVLWLIIYAVFKYPEINFKNISFMVEIISLFWVSSFIFRFSSPIVAKGILHSIICFMLSVILFSLNFSYVPDAKLLLAYMLLFFSVYALCLAGLTKLSRKINSPLRYFPEWIFKLRQHGEKQSKHIQNSID